MNKKELKINEKSQNKTTSKNSSNLISNLQSPNSNFSIPTSHFSTLTSNSRGITLIALVITIIVMLILVGVTVSVAINGGLFNTAKDAARKTQLEADRESLLSAVIGAINDNAEVNFDKLGKSLPEGFTINEDGYKSESGNTFFVDRDGNINTVTIVEEKATTNDYGKYVKYGVDLNGDGILTNDWKVFYVDYEGNTFIISADYVTGDKCTKVETAIQNSHMTKSAESDREYCYYWKKSDVTGDSPKVTYHCNDGHNKDLNNDKGQCSYPNLFMATKYYCSDHVGDGNGGNINSRCASTLLCSENWKPLVDENYGATHAIGGPTIEMWVASWNQKHGDTEDSTSKLYCSRESKNDLGYCIGINENELKYYYNVSSCAEGYYDTLYFPHQTKTNLALDGDGDTDDYCVGYWLASPCGGSANNVDGIDYFGGVTNSAYYGIDYSLRPVVCITSSVKLATNEEN